MDSDEKMRELSRQSMMGCLAFLVGFLAGAIVFVPMLYCCGAGEREIVTDTVLVRDTLREIRPVPSAGKDTVVRYVRVVLSAQPKHTGTRDSVAVVQQQTEPVDSVLLAITQKTYTDDSTYTAWVSGYEAALDSIEVYRKREIVTNTILQKSGKRWSVGVQGGVYMTPKGMQPGIGVGVIWTLWPP